MIGGDCLSQSVTAARQIWAQMLQVETNGTTTKVPVPFVVVFDKRRRPDNRGGIKQVYLLASLKTQRERRNVAQGLPFPERDPREARERAGKGKPRADN